MEILVRALAVFSLLVPCATWGGDASAPAVRTVGELVAAINGDKCATTAFDLNVAVSSLRFTPSDPTLSVFDETEAITMMFHPLLETNLDVRAGDRLHVMGHIAAKPRIGKMYAYCERFEFLGHGVAPEPVDADFADLASGRCDNRAVRISGTVQDVFVDEIDPVFTFVTFASGARAVHVAIPGMDESEIASTRGLIGCKASAVGICTRSVLGGRQHVGRIVCLAGPSDLRRLDSAPYDIFNAPPLKLLAELDPQDIATYKRHVARGQVLAAWGKGNVLLRSPDGEVFRAEFATDRVPANGTFVEVVGFPESDMFTLGLARAAWRSAQPWETRPPQVTPLSGKAINSSADGSRGFDPLLLGQLVRIRGLVTNISTDGRQAVRLYLQDGAYLIPVDVSGVRGLTEDMLNCHVSVTGVCALNVDRWRPNAAFPRIHEIFVVIRTPDDVQILAKAPWWTPSRLLAAIVMLLASLAGFALWNRHLKHAVEAKGRELEHEIIDRIGSDFKAQERTRLAVELHDSLSQTLTGVAMKINAAKRALPPDGDVAMGHLDLAARTLASCRDELKNCLWDLRNNALEDDDMAEAIRRIVTPHLGDASLSVRFAALRDRFTDTTAHALLRIIRELATNSVRHGHATSVQIAGIMEDNTLRISVKDNGFGFDVDSAPGMELGHFGLEGIRERLREFNGTLDIKSSPDRGTRAVVTLVLPPEEIPTP